VGELCSILSANSDHRNDIPSVPLTVQRAFPDAKFLPEAMMTLLDCKGILTDLFADMGWETRSLSEDVAKLAKHTRRQLRVRKRAHGIAVGLSRLTPSFPLSSTVTDPVEQLITAAECVLEELSEQGVLYDPSSGHARSQLKSPKRTRRTAVNLTDLDDSVGPEAAAVNAHVFETQLKSLQDHLRQETGEKRECIQELDRCREENAQLTEQRDCAVKRVTQLESELEKMQKHLLSAKKKVATYSAEENERRELTARLQESERRSRALELQLSRAQLDAHENVEGEVLTRDEMIEELLKCVKDLIEELDTLKNAAASARNIILDQHSNVAIHRKQQDQTRERLHSFLGSRDEVVRDLDAVIRWVQEHPDNQSINPRIAPRVDRAALLSQLAPIKDKLKDRLPLAIGDRRYL
jgi:hypothetical protein